MKQFFIFFLSLFITCMASAQQPAIHYSLGMSKPSTHILEVEITFDYLPNDIRGLDIRLPVWRPGRYLVLDLASGVQEFSAVDGKRKPLDFQKTEKSTWHVETKGSSKIIVSYNVYANEFALRTRGVNDEHAFIDGSAVFMYVEQFRNLPVVLTVKPYGNWHVTTGLEGDGKKFTAPDYDYFVDCPLEIGTQQDFNFSVDGVPHVLSIFGQGNWNADTLIKDISAIVKAQKEFWGEFPYRRYVFLLHCTLSSGGGTEHINSTAMGIRPYVFKNPDSYRSFLGLVSHEYFHTWNVKQLRPKGIHPYDYTKENYTRELWVAEGTTSYYENIFLLRLGFMKPEKYLEQLASNIQADRQRPGNTVQSVSESSFDAWVKYWKGTEQSFNSESDYYGKGADVSLLLDLEIRKMTNGTRSLDNVMRAMYKRFPLSGTGYTLADFLHTSDEIAGGSLQNFFDHYVYGTTPLPWEKTLLYTGLELISKDSVAKPWIGALMNDVGEKTRVTRVIAGSPAQKAGVDIGDEVLALNGNRVRTADLNDRLSELKVGDTIILPLFHNDRLHERKILVEHAPVPAYKIIKTASPTTPQKQLYDDWLKTVL